MITILFEGKIWGCEKGITLGQAIALARSWRKTRTPIGLDCPIVYLDGVPIWGISLQRKEMTPTQESAHYGAIAAESREWMSTDGRHLSRCTRSQK